MNRYTALTLLACSITLTAGATEPVAESDSIMIAADTGAVIENPNRIIVTESSASTTIEVNGTQHRPDYHFSYSINADTTAVAPFSFTLPIIGDKLSHPSSSQITFFSSIYFGAVLPYHSPDPVRASWEYGVDVIGKRYNYRGASFCIAVGIGGKEIAIRRGTTAECDNDRLLLLPAPVGASDTRTHLSMGYISVPVYYRQKIHRSLSFKLAAELHYNFLMRGKTEYTLDGVEYTRKLTGLHQRAVTPEFSFTIGTVDFGGVYVKWAPVSLFKSAYGPRISTYSIGFTLSF